MLHSLDRLASAAAVVDGIRTGDLLPGDWVIVCTKNSTYSLLANADGTFQASGGWFNRFDQQSERVRIAGCTWGGSVLFTRMIAGPGMFLEFANNVRTTRIREVRHLRPTAAPTVH